MASARTSDTGRSPPGPFASVSRTMAGGQGAQPVRGPLRTEHGRPVAHRGVVEAWRHDAVRGVCEAERVAGLVRGDTADGDQAEARRGPSCEAHEIVREPDLAVAPAAGGAAVYGGGVGRLPRHDAGVAAAIAVVRPPSLSVADEPLHDGRRGPLTVEDGR